MASTPAKRPRTPSSSSFASPTSDPPHKASRVLLQPTSPTSNRTSSSTSTSSFGSDSTVKQGPIAAAVPLLCTLAPTCHRQPTPIANTNELEKHYATYHAHVCGLKTCGCVFPDARLLELHQTECHDPLSALRKERGEKIFQCHVAAPTCGRNFLTPKARRLHLIQAHEFPKEYFFAVTNKGIGGLLKRWGEGASMIRKEWKPRNGDGKESLDTMRFRDEDDKMDEDEDEEDEDEESEEDEEDDADLEATPRMLPRTTGIHSPQSSVSSSQSQRQKHSKNPKEDPGVAGLADTLDSLSLVPNSVRFGRGGHSGGFIPNVHGGRGRGRGRGRGGFIANPTGLGPQQPAMDVDGAQPSTRKGGRGRKVETETQTTQDGPQTGFDPARGRGGGRGRARARGRGRGGRGGGP
ncbi:hypothetical protein M413DRAFT_442418 [Hebeloma cylindrosporum]|uniref:C2H2-type domain-containing protein n=1 Tax=Hebeloma cylindrosporum TaxID=76867 RepID=A0A0C2YTT0_HEBCY|nr:hypothetical protein M413DRAFT_442418 [Hebeloma cylindrosporum h7]